MPSKASLLPNLGPDVYAQWRASGIGAITEQLQRRLILSLLGEVSGRHILDVGCGDGDLAIELLRRGAYVTGIDSSSDMITVAKARAKREGVDIEFVVGAGERMPFAAESFDAVVVVTILCFVANAGPVFQEIARVLRPGGLLANSESEVPLCRRDRLRAPGSPLLKRKPRRGITGVFGIDGRARGYATGRLC